MSEQMEKRIRAKVSKEPAPPKNPRAPKTIGTNVDPFTLAKRAWNFNMRGGMLALRTSWTITIMSLAIMVISLIYAFGAITAPKYIPYMVTIDKSTGEFAFKGMLTESNLTIDDNVIRNLLRNFILKIRSVSSDIVVVKRGWYEASFFTTDSGREKLAALYATYQPVEICKKFKTVDLTFEEYDHVSEHTWIVRWNEVVSNDGHVLQRIPQSGTFTFTKTVPDNPEAALINPIGISFTDFYINSYRTENQ